MRERHRDGGYANAESSGGMPGKFHGIQSASNTIIPAAGLPAKKAGGPVKPPNQNFFP